MTIPRFIHKNILYLHIKTFLQRFDAYLYIIKMFINIWPISQISLRTFCKMLVSLLNDNTSLINVIPTKYWNYKTQ